MARTITDPTEAASALASSVKAAGSVVFFGGAGVSTASGIPDFRSEDGLYHQHFAYPPETMLSHSFYVSHTKEVYDFYRERMIALDARPNRAHYKLASAPQRVPAVRCHAVCGMGYADYGCATLSRVRGSHQT